MVRRGEIWWYEPPDDKARPYLILTRDDIISLLAEVLAVPATRRRRGIPTEVELDTTDGMPHACVLTLDNTQPIERSYCTRRIAMLGPERMDQVCRALHVAVDC